MVESCAMAEPGKQLREEIERLGKAAEVGLEAIRRDFEAEIRAMTSCVDSKPEEVVRRVSEAVARFHRKLEARLREVRIRVDERFGSVPKPPHPRPYVERFPPRTPNPRGRKRPSAGGVLVKPDKPIDMSGGAAAPLEFD
jgi:hypothetical protein